MSTVIIMAGGTGGHIYPALAVGAALRERGVNVFWMGVRNGLEDRLAREQGFEFDSVKSRGLWGKGPGRWLTMPLWLTMAVLQSIGIILRRRPDALLGMGGYVCGPGGLAGWILRRPLVIHESNVIPGLTNRVLAHVATRILTGFAETSIAGHPIWVGTPVRSAIIAAARRSDQAESPRQTANLLVVGGSQGARILNESIPEAVAMLPGELLPNIRHQSGTGRSPDTQRRYQALNIEAEAVDYIDDMAEAYRWADIIVARAGAMSLAEISTVGLAAVLVPFPHAARDHQRVNAQVFLDQGCALVCVQGDDLIQCLAARLKALLSDRNLVGQMSSRIRKMAKPESTDQVVHHCMEVMQV